MDIKLFNDTLKLINGCFPEDKDIIEDEFLYYLLGYTNKTPETKNDTYLISLAAPLKNCLTGKKHSATHLEAIIQTSYPTAKI